MVAAGTQLGPYQLLAPLGAGGMGEVYRARDTRLGRQVAVKVISEAFAQDPDRLARFEREAKAVAALEHPNILVLHDFGTDRSVTYTVTELLEGETLRTRLRKGAVPWRKAVEIGVAIADGLAAAHTKGIIHRDLKPENLFLTSDGRVKILDFGLARSEPASSSEAETGTYVPAQTELGTVMGTAGYMSPEQVRALPVDARSDIFSLGCVLYEMVTGQRAFARPTGAETMTAILHDEPPELSASGRQVPLEVDRVIRHGLEKNPAARFHSAHDLAFALRAILSDSGLAKSSVAPTQQRAWPVIWLVAALVLVGLLVTSLYLLLVRDSGGPDASKPALAAQAIEAIAVLPFVNESNDPEAEHLSDGIPETIIKSLYQVRRLKVRPFTSVARYKGRLKDLDLQEVARQLNVQGVLTGKLTLRKDRLSLRVELVDVRDLSGLWSDQFDRQRTDIQAVQDEITQQICAKLGIQLTDEEQKRLIKHYTENTEAYDLYLKGRLQLKKMTVGAVKKAIEYFQEAVDTDPRYALAYTGLADSYSILAQWGYLRARDASPRARKAAEDALKIDATLSEAHTSLAYVKMDFDRDWLAAETEFRRAIELDANNADARHWYSHYLTAMGRTAESLAAAKRALELDPLNATFMVHLGWHFYYARQYDDALEQLRMAIDMAPKHGMAHVFRAQAYVQKASHAEAIDQAQQATVLTPEWSAAGAILGYAYAVSGKKDAALKVLDELTALSAWKDVSYYKALIYAGLGQKEQALEWLEKAYAERSPHLVYLKVEPIFESLRADPRFQGLLRRMGLADNAADRPIDSIAILPFANTSSDPDTEFLSDGIAESIINNLSQLTRLKVMSRNSVFLFKGKDADAQSVGRQLGVQAVMTGELRQRGDSLFISVELVKVLDGSHLWGERYNRKAADILAVQDEITKEITEKLRLKLTPAEQQRLAKRPTENTEAYQAYLKGRYFWNRMGSNPAMSYFQNAIDRDPSYAAAYAGVADCYQTMVPPEGLSPREGWSKAIAAATKAVELDDTLADPHVALAMAKGFYDWDWEGSERSFKRALALNPNYAIAQNFYGHFLSALGRREEAIAATRRYLDLEPTLPAPHFRMGLALYHARRYDEAIDYYRKGLQLQPDFFNHYLGMAYEQKGMFREAIAELRKQLAPYILVKPPRFLAVLAHAYAVSGQRVEAEKILAELRGQSKYRYVSAYSLAIIYAGLGDKDQAFTWLEKAYTERAYWMTFVKVDPHLDNLRSDPRFADLLRRMNLPVHHDKP